MSTTIRLEMEMEMETNKQDVQPRATRRARYAINLAAWKVSYSATIQVRNRRLPTFAED